MTSKEWKRLKRFVDEHFSDPRAVRSTTFYIRLQRPFVAWKVSPTKANDWMNIGSPLYEGEHLIINAYIDYVSFPGLKPIKRIHRRFVKSVRLSVSKKVHGDKWEVNYF